MDKGKLCRDRRGVTATAMLSRFFIHPAAGSCLVLGQMLLCSQRGCRVDA